MATFPNGYSYTSAGREWLTRTELDFVPIEPSRYTNLLSKESLRLGHGFAQRAQEAAACHQAANHLACCAMCGAAAESAILQAAIAKSKNEDSVLKVYIKPNGRRKVLEIIFGTEPSKLDQKFISTAANLLFYWRDESAHGKISALSEIEAFNALTTLVRFAQHLYANWPAPDKS
jgi:hypothetical protein